MNSGSTQSSLEHVIHGGHGNARMAERHHICLETALEDGIQAFQNNILPTVMAASDMRANILRGTAVRTTSPAAAAKTKVPRCPAHTEAVSGIMITHATYLTATACDEHRQ